MKKRRKLTLPRETIRILMSSEQRAATGGIQTGSQVGTVCNTCAFSCDPAACQPPPSN